jgi:hypothetical protein
MSTGLPATASVSRTSKNALNSALYEAVKIGVMAISPSARVTCSIAACSCGDGNPVSRLSMSARELSHLDDVHQHLGSACCQ